MGGEKHLLCSVLGLGVVAQERAAEPGHRGSVLPEEHLGVLRPATALDCR